MRNRLKGLTKLHIKVPDLHRERIRYVWDYVKAVGAGLLQKPKLQANIPYRFVSSDLRLTAEEIKQWNAIFNAPLDEIYPFDYFSSVKPMILNSFLRALNLNLRHLLHLQNEVFIHSLDYKIENHPSYEVKAELVDITPIRETDRLIVRFVSKVYLEDGQLLRETYDSFLIRKITREDIETAKTHFEQQPISPATFANLSRKKSMLVDQANVNVIEMKVSKSMARQFAHVSGDYNPIHTLGWFSRLFGHKRNFIQGLCTSNFILANLYRQVGGNFHGYSITYTKPIYVGQKIRLLFKEHHFDVVNKKNKLLAFGKYY